MTQSPWVQLAPSTRRSRLRTAEALIALNKPSTPTEWRNVAYLSSVPEHILRRLYDDAAPPSTKRSGQYDAVREDRVEPEAQLPPDRVVRRMFDRTLLGTGSGHYVSITLPRVVCIDGPAP